ncbi:hypothetical protein NM208_g3585 [Fusarium decemcellulare]|uniref:Uncharacterized protein n=1 Tax=Fusarium decemcellulare TaxID=57161 RepID=A0ACC1SNK5_9HYPO|nr:hypothetical protein NM208_g3585 [Fusarium decemcellulare]
MNSRALRIVETVDALPLARATFNDPGATVLSASYSGKATSSWTFALGPFGKENRAILTTRRAKETLPRGDIQVDNGPSRSPFCFEEPSDGAGLTVDIFIDLAFTALQPQFIFTSVNYLSGDSIGIWLDGTSISRDDNGITIDTTSHLLEDHYHIEKPASMTP